MTTNIQSFAGDVQIESGNLSVKSLEVRDGVTKLASNNTAYSNVGVMMTRKDGASNVAFLFSENGANVVLGYTNDDALEGDRIDILVDEKANLVVYGNVYVTGSVHGDGSTLTGLVTTLQSVTEFGASTDQTLSLTNATTGVEVTSNVVVSGNVTALTFIGDGSQLDGIAATLEEIVINGNVTSNVVEFRNATSLVTTGNVGISNLAPTGDLCIGANVIINDESLDKIDVTGNIACHQLNLGSIEILPAYSLENVTGIGNTTPNVVSFKNTTLAFDTDKMAGIGIIPSAADVGVSGLHVDGHLRLGGAAGNTDEEQMYVKAAGALGVLANQSDTNNTNTGLRLQAGDTNDSNITLYGDFSTTTKQYISMATRNTERLRIDRDGNVGIGTDTPAYTLDVAGKSRLGTVVLNPQTYLMSNVNYFEYTSSTITTFNKVLLQIDKSGTGNADHAEYSGYVDCEIVAQRSITNGGPEIFTSRVNFMAAYDDAYDIWKIKTFVQENKSFFKYISFTSTPVFKYKYDGRQLQLYVSFDAKEIRSYISFTARITSDGNHINDVSLPDPDALMGTGTDGTAELGICYGVGANASNVGIGISDPTSKFHVEGNAYVSSNLTVGTANLHVDTTTGFVGVGTTSPLAKLDIAATKGSIFATTPNDLVSNASVRISGFVESADALCIGMLTTSTSDTGNNPYAYIQNFWDIDTPKPILLNPAGGNIGIGTTNPATTLHVDGTITIRNGSQANAIRTDSDGNLQFLRNDASNDTPSITINDDTGNVGIGITNPDYTLDVNGTVNTGALTATTGTFSGALQCNSFTLSSTPGEYGEFIVERKDNGYTQASLPLANTTSFVWDTSILDANYTTVTSKRTFTINDDNTGSRWMLKFLHTDADIASNVRVRVNSGTLHGLSYNDVPQDPREDGDLSWTTIDITDDVVYAGGVNTVYWWSNNTDSGTIEAVYVFPTSGPALPNEPVETDLHLYNGLFVKGNVGIGTTSPDGNAKLDVVGDIKRSGATYTKAYTYGSITANDDLYIGRFSIYAPPAKIDIYDSGTGLGSGSRFSLARHYDKTPRVQGFENSFYTIYKFYYQAVNQTTYDVWFRSSRDGNYIVHVDATGFTDTTEPSSPTLTECEYGLFTADGKVGIGTVSPSVSLHVASSNFISDETGPAASANNVFRVSSTEVDSTLLIGASDTGSYISSFSKGNFATQRNLILNANGGNVGIGTTSPGSTSYAPGKSLHLYDGGGIGSAYTGSVLSSSAKPRTSLLFQKYTSAPGAIANDDVIGFISLNWMPYRPTRPYGVGMYAVRTSGTHDDQANMNFFVTNGGNDTDTDALIIDGNGGSQSIVTTNGATVTSDDRLKTGETVIRNALKSIKKLTPQLYAKHPFYGSFSELKQNVKCESGLIVQDVWYDAPEFRHLVMKDKAAIPTKEKPTEPVPGDITVDPDYSDWGNKPASLNYTGLIPYIISSIKELCEEIPHRKISTPPELFSNIEQYHGLIVSKRGDISLSSRVKDKCVYGVVSETQPKYTENSEIYTKSHGEEGHVWIINTSNLEAGDYITTSGVAGYGEKQDSEFLTNYTVAKITMDCDFTQPNVPVKRVVQSLESVNYWVYKHCIGIAKEVYDTLPEEDRCTSTREIYKLNGEQINPTTSNVFDSNTNTYTEVTVNPEDVPGAELEIITEYCKIDRIEFKKEIPGLDLEVRQELVNVLDAHGQLQWEDTEETEKAYKIRYLTADGTQTDEANAVHIAAFVGCTYHCG